MFHRKKKKNIYFESVNQAAGMTQGVVQHKNLFPNFQSRYITFPNSKIYYLAIIS